ncbi:hypothetical protein [Patulibacter americanus]|uniref:hypothetical protein n=1 Tax=Patulibacter americanus TaxID=588672 RepID=UPI0003B2F710|nr:hypothetical protein [Patulibacter americanus]
MALWRVWWRFGALPALAVVTLFFALAGAAALLLDEATAGVIGGALFAGFVAYCVARPAQGWDVFSAAAAPNAFTYMAHELLGAPPWLFLVLLPIALVWVWSIDRDGDPEGEDGTPVDAARSDATPPAAPL